MFTCDLQVWTQNLDQDLVTAVESSHSINTAPVSDRAKWLMQKQLLSTALDEVTRSRQCGYPAGWLVQQLWAVLTQSFSLSPFTTFVALTQIASITWLKFCTACSHFWTSLLECLVGLLSPTAWSDYLQVCCQSYCLHRPTQPLWVQWTRTTILPVSQVIASDCKWPNKRSADKG